MRVRSRCRRGLAAWLGFALAAASSAAAQTTDPPFRSWEWDAEPHSVRAAALAGAVAAEPADGSSALLHPSGLSLLSEPALRASARQANAGELGADATRARWTLGEVALTLPVGLRWGLGVYRHAPRSLALTLGEAPLPDGSRDAGGLRADVGEYGAAVGYALAPSWRVGVRVGLAHLDLEASSTTQPGSQGGGREVSTVLDANQPRVAASLLFAPEQRLQLGLTWTSRARWSGRLQDGDASLPWELSAPDRLALGVLYRPSGVVLFLGQVDRVGWASVGEAVVALPGRPDADEFDLHSAWEYRLALELQPVWGEFGTWQRPALRLGWRSRSRGILAYAGTDVVEAARFPGAQRSDEWSLGMAVGPLEAAWISREPASVWLLGIRHAF